MTDDEKATLREAQTALAEAERAIDAASIKVRSLVGPLRHRRGTGGSDQGKSGGDN